MYLNCRDKYGGKKYESEVQITGKTVIVTGANTGIGKEIARSLAKRGKTNNSIH